MNAKFWPQSGIFVLHSKGPKYAEMLADGSVHRSSVDPNCDVGQPMSRARNWRAEALAEGWRRSPSDYHRGSAAGRATRVRARTGEKRRVHRAKHRPRFKASGFAPPAVGNGSGHTPTDPPQNGHRRSTAAIKKRSWPQPRVRAPRRLRGSPFGSLAIVRRTPWAQG